MGERVPPDTGHALTAEMRLLDSRLLEAARGTLERWGGTFRAYAAYIPDTAGRLRAIEIGEESFVDTRQPGVHRDSLRSAVRKHQRYMPRARTAGIITDSVSGPIEEVIDGADGPAFPRMSITELEDKWGRCRRLERDYRFVANPKGDWGQGTIVFDAPRISRCEPSDYWRDTLTAPPPAAVRPRLTAPIVRPLEISSLANYFSVVGVFHGKLTVFDDSIVVNFDSLMARRMNPNDPQPVRVDSIRVAVGMGDDNRWSPVDNSKAVQVERVLVGPATLVEHNVRFVLRHERRDEDADSWIVVTFHLTVGRPGDARYQPHATTYAHSVKGVLR
ncbi:MAG TPA: hypothetical protein VM166_02605 [Gemmatimonadaceae bacterium]|nr:hypothetical protein [Gemmatimonadaceae bacterium]